MNLDTRHYFRLWPSTNNRSSRLWASTIITISGYEPRHASLFQVVSLDTLVILSRSSCTQIEFSSHGQYNRCVCFQLSLSCGHIHSGQKSKETHFTISKRPASPTYHFSREDNPCFGSDINFKRGLYILCMVPVCTLILMTNMDHITAPDR